MYVYISFVWSCLGNHRKMLLGTGYKAENIKEYRYFDSASKLLDFSGMCEDLKVIMKSLIFLNIIIVVQLRVIFWGLSLY